MTCCLVPSLLYSKDQTYSTQISTLLLQYAFSKLDSWQNITSNFLANLFHLQLVGVRIPHHDFMRRLCQMCGEPLALTSANISSHTSTVAVHVSCEHVTVKQNVCCNCFFILIKWHLPTLFFRWRNFRSSGQILQWWWMVDQSEVKAASVQQWLTYQCVANTASLDRAGEFRL